MKTLWDQRYAQRTQRISGSIIRELLKLADQEGVISFAGGLPAPDVFPVAEVAEATSRVLKEHGAQALQYSTTEGYRPLRELLARHTARYGLHVTPDNILITSGSQQALDLLGKVFINRGDRILVEAPTYLGALQAWNSYGAEYLPVHTDEHGMDMIEIESALRASPKFIYALPNFQNPTGVTLSMERRRLLVALADHYGVPIIEDDPYGQLRYEGRHLPPLAVLADRRQGFERGEQSEQNEQEFIHPDLDTYTGNVIYLSTFSKTLAPGLRLGWIIAPRDVISKLAQAKQGTDLHTSTFTQMVAYEVARQGFLDQHIRLIRRVYGERRDIMLASMQEHFPEEMRWTHPHGGLFLWVTLPSYLNAAELLKEALQRKVAFVPGSSFFPDGGGHNTLRLNFSNANPEAIREGIGRLGIVLKSALDKPVQHHEYALATP